MSTQVTKLTPAGTAPLLLGNKDLADGLRKYADRIEAGEIGDCQNYLLITSTTKGPSLHSAGGPELTMYYTLGLLEVAKTTIFDNW